MAATIPAWETARKIRCFQQFIKLKCVKNGHENMGINAIDFDVTKLDVVKMKAHILDCIAALGVVQQEFVDQKLPLVLNEGEQPLSVQAQAVSNDVFTNVAMSLMLTTLTSEGAEKPEHSESVKQLLRAFPDESKLTDGRGWLPLHWATVTDRMTEADIKVLYATDPMAMQQYHLEGTDDDNMGFTPAHLLCMREVTNRSYSLIQYFSVCNSEAFTMSASYADRSDPSLRIFSALHAACCSGQPTEELLKHLIQLDSTQIKKKCSENGLTPLGHICQNIRCGDGLVNCLLEVDSSAEVVGNGIVGCLRSTDCVRMLERVEILLKANPEAAKYRNSSEMNLLHLAAYNKTMPFHLCIDVMQRIHAIHKDAVREVDDEGGLPVHYAAQFSTVEVMEFLLGLYPESASVVTTSGSSNLLYLAVFDNKNTPSVLEAKVRFLRTRYPAMMLQKDGNGLIPFHVVIRYKNIPVVLILCKAGGQELVRVPVAHPTDINCKWNGWLPLHYLIYWNAESLHDSLFSKEADYFRMFLRWYPEAAGIEGGIGARYKKTPYQLAVDENLPPYYLRLLLRAAPDLNPAELHRLNYAERRMAMFLAFKGVSRNIEPLLLTRLRFAKKDLLKHVMSFL